ncbi:MAG TPA: hypothetical protein GXZ87_11365 [Bacteroidales bacterium]|nr:hypothetical protein [Bacteroidales bacterium]
MRDFTLKTYKHLLQSFLSRNYKLINYSAYCKGVDADKFLILRHDVDEIAGNALKMAKLEHELGVSATYYFRIVQQSNKPEIIRKIASLGHEIGYHYEDLALAKGDLQFAKQTFEENLAYFRTFYPVKTVCMHGSSTSKYDNREFWKNFELKDFGLIGEPYLTTNFNEVYYLTDTGYAWDGGKFAVRDMVENSFDVTYHSSDDIIKVVEAGTFPDKCLMLAHTLWTDGYFQWTMLHIREFLRNNLKYVAQRNKLAKTIYSKLVKAYWKS